MGSTTDIMVIVAVVISVIVIAVIIVHLFVHRKKITQVTVNNMDDDIYPTLTVTSAKTVTLDDQTFNTHFGKVFISSDEAKVNADTSSAVVIQVLDGPATFTSAVGAAATFKVRNKTDNILHVNGGNYITDFNAGVTDFAYNKPLNGSIKPISISAKGSTTTYFTLIGAPATDLGLVKFQLGLSVVRA